MNIKKNYTDLFEQFKDEHTEFHKKIDTNEQSPIYIGVTEDKLPYFMFEYPQDKISNIKYVNSCSGFHIYKNKISATSKYSNIQIVARESDNLDLYYNVIQDIIDIILPLKKRTIDTLVDRLVAWVKFFKKTNLGVMSFRNQVGLWGELTYIEKSLSEKKNYHIIDCWKGPKASSKDFVFGRKAVEIKTSIQDDSPVIHISNEHQLDKTGFDELFLKLYLIEEDNADGRNIPEIVDSISSLLDSNLDVQEQFYSLLMEAGYNDAFRDSYNNYFLQCKESSFIVDDNFPKITAAENIDRGISHISYDIDLAYCMKSEDVEGTTDKLPGASK